MDEYGLQQGFPPVGDSYYWVGDEQINRKLEVLVGDIGLQNIKKFFKICYPEKYWKEICKEPVYIKKTKWL